MQGTLAVIDMQKVFGTEGSDWYTAGFGAIVPVIARLEEAFGDAVVLTRYVAPAQPWGSWVPYFEDWPAERQPREAELWDIVDGVFRPGAPVVTAVTFSKWGLELAGLVRDNRLILTGVSTDCCVLSTALAAADAGIEVWVVSDATAGLDQATEQQALYIMGLYGPLIKIVTAAEVLGRGV
ncbi:MAG: cysteine hydrolase [Propionibacteriaceae bacterium]|jgi:nicotinamidase-related amidase|nr:cysteine hydrolase [Propionibacteriaceae bacterium]